jgi:phosphatidylserine/phosphatidylglycerophosphate/cardiolipin synthase-like enzyme
VEIELYFPRAGDPADERLADWLAAPTTALRLAIYSLNNPRIVAAIGLQWGRHVPTRLLVDQVQAAGREEEAVLAGFLQAGLPIRSDHHAGLMHLKMAVRGDPPDSLATGSFNWTNNAQAVNDEMLAIVHDADLAAEAAAVFDRMWNNPLGYRDWHPPTADERRAMMARLNVQPEF